MSTIAAGRANTLQERIVKAILRAKEHDTLASGGVEYIFGDLLKDPVIKQLVENATD